MPMATKSFDDVVGLDKISGEDTRPATTSADLSARFDAKSLIKNPIKPPHLFSAYKFPDDIMREIFLDVVHDPPSGTPGDHFFVHYSSQAMTLALKVSQVSKEWRSMALANTRTWSIIRAGKGTSSEAKVVQLFLKRSRSCLPDIVVHEIRNSKYESIDLSLLMGTLMEHLGRWQLFEFAGDITYLQKTHSSLTTFAQNLRFFSARNSKPLPEPINTFAEAPLLDEVEFVGVQSRHITLPWSQIIAFDAYNTTLTDCLNILRVCTRLEELDVEMLDLGPEDDSPDEPVVPPVIASTITSLSIRSTMDTSTLLSWATFRVLEELFLDIDCILDPEFRCLLHHLNATEPSIRTFSMRIRVRCSPNRYDLSKEIVGLLKSMPSLVTLELCGDIFLDTDGGALLHWLCTDRVLVGSSSAELAKLKSLTVETSDTNLADVYARCGALGRLNELGVEVLHEVIDPDDYE